MTNLDVFAASNLGEVFLSLEGLVGAVVCGGGTDDAEPCLNHVATLREHKELTEERHCDQFTIQLGRHTRHFGETLTVEQPEPTDQSQYELSSREHARA